MSKKHRKVQFMIDDEVTFKNDVDEQHQGFFYVNDIICHKEVLYYQLYRLTDYQKDLVPEYYTEDQLLLVKPFDSQPIVSKKKKKKHKKHHKKSKKLEYQQLVFLVVYHCTDVSNSVIIETVTHISMKLAWKSILKKYPTAIKYFIQAIDEN